VDAFAQVWPEVERRLSREPRLLAKTLWEELTKDDHGRFARGQRRSFERRVRAWKRGHGPEPELVFAQEHRPGERMQLDWVCGRRLQVTILGNWLDHKLAHVVLPYSNWEWARVCRSESLLSLKVGLQSGLWELGGAPGVCQTDHGSAATHRRGAGRSGRDYNERYLGVLAHYGMRPGLIAIKEPRQNGDVEGAHGHLMREWEQRLLLRGSREFASLAEYEDLLFGLLRERNAGRWERVAEERGSLRPLPLSRLAEYEDCETRVSREGIARVGRQGYSLPARWVGRSLRARWDERRIWFYDGADCVLEVERMLGNCGVYVNWRHVLPQLVRKPGAFARWRHREWMFPSLSWRKLYDGLIDRHSEGRAEREYLGILSLALEHGLERLEEMLGRRGWERANLDEMRRGFNETRKVVVVDFRADLSGYDALIAEEEGAVGKERELGHGA
jgi:hypothetical protein